MLDGSRMRRASPAGAPRAGVAMIYQELSLAPDLDRGREHSARHGTGAVRLVRRGRRMRRSPRAALPSSVVRTISTGRAGRRRRVADRQLVEIARAIARRAAACSCSTSPPPAGRRDLERLFALDRAPEEPAARDRLHLPLPRGSAAGRRCAIVVLRDGRAVAAAGHRRRRGERSSPSMVGREVDELFARSPAQAGESRRSHSISSPVSAFSR